MNITDINLLGKKIVVGVLIFLAPLLIISGGLWLTHHLLKKDSIQQHQSK